MSDLQSPIWPKDPSSQVHGMPDGTGVVRGQRISDEERDRAEHFLTKMFTQGRLREHELDRRVAALREAVTVFQLTSLLSDLPGYEEPEPQTVLQRLSSRSSETIAAIVVAIEISVGFILIPWILANGSSNNIFFALAALSSITGVAGIVGSLIWASRVYEWS